MKLKDLLELFGLKELIFNPTAEDLCGYGNFYNMVAEYGNNIMLIIKDHLEAIRENSDKYTLQIQQKVYKDGGIQTIVKYILLEL